MQISIEITFEKKFHISYETTILKKSIYNEDNVKLLSDGFLGVLQLLIAKYKIMERVDTQQKEKILGSTQSLSTTNAVTKNITQEQYSRKNYDSPAFYCAVCEQKHLAGTPRMQCEACGRNICVDSFSEMAKAGRMTCPMCDGKLSPYT